MYIPLWYYVFVTFVCLKGSYYALYVSDDGILLSICCIGLCCVPLALVLDKMAKHKETWNEMEIRMLRGN